MINLKITTNKGEYNIKCNKGEAMKNIINKEDIRFLFPCGGAGRCGNCIVKIIKGDKTITNLDNMKIEKRLIDDGYRLACNIHLKEDMEIYLKEIGTISL